MKTYTFEGKIVITESETIENIKGKIECLPSGEIVFLAEKDNTELIKLGNAWKCRIEGTTTDRFTKIIIENAYRNSVSSDRESGRSFEQFDVRTLELVTPISGKECRQKWEIDFFLSDLRIARAAVMRERNSDGSRKIERVNITKVALYGDMSVAFDKYYSWENAELHGGKGDFVYSNEVARVTIPRTTGDNFKDTLEKAIQNLDNLLLIVSFAQRKWVYWYSYRTSTDTQVIKYMRSYRRTPNLQGKEYSLGEFIINPGKEEEFLSNSITEYAKLLSEEIDLRLPFIYLIGGHDREITDARFLSYCVSLETLLAIFGKKSVIRTENMPKEKFKLLRCKIEKIIENERDEEKLGSDECENILSKMSSLNYQSLNSLTKQFLDYYKVQHDDLDIKQILKFRNDLLHGRGIEDKYYEFLKATVHLQWLLERSFLRVLNWTKSSNVGPESLSIRFSIFK